MDLTLGRQLQIGQHDNVSRKSVSLFHLASFLPVTVGAITSAQCYLVCLIVHPNQIDSNLFIIGLEILRLLQGECC